MSTEVNEALNNSDAVIKEFIDMRDKLKIAEEALRQIDDLSNFNQYSPVVVNGLFDQTSFDKGYKAAMYQLHKKAKAALASINRELLNKT